MAENVEYFTSDGKPKKEKKQRKVGAPLLFVILVGVIIILSNILVVTHQNEYKLIRQFGKVQKVVSQPGLTVKIPLIQTIDTIPQQILLYDLPASDVITSDKKTRIV